MKRNSYKGVGKGTCKLSVGRHPSEAGYVIGNQRDRHIIPDGSGEPRGVDDENTTSQQRLDRPDDPKERHQGEEDRAKEMLCESLAEVALGYRAK